MSAIRSGLPQPSPSPVGEPAQARSAQAAFFRAALNQQTQTPEASAKVAAAEVMSAVRTANPARPVEPPPASPEREAPRILRPGSYLDIKV